ncbi:MAG: helix-turn-helix transcriptional regulator [Deltaproteobacteria bacterium]|nr:MAG: helix-turn-helix transcriptional regulator [Deltaproteobacteria bacterium]
MQKNNVKKLRESRMLSKTELARMAGISPLTLDRIEKGKACRLSTKRKILLALGLKTHQKRRVFRQ